MVYLDAVKVWYLLARNDGRGDFREEISIQHENVFSEGVVLLDSIVGDSTQEFVIQRVRLVSGGPRHKTKDSEGTHQRTRACRKVFVPSGDGTREMGVL